MTLLPLPFHVIGASEPAPHSTCTHWSTVSSTNCIAVDASSIGMVSTAPSSSVRKRNLLPTRAPGSSIPAQHRESRFRGQGKIRPHCRSRYTDADKGHVLEMPAGLRYAGGAQMEYVRGCAPIRHASLASRPIRNGTSRRWTSMGSSRRRVCCWRRRRRMTSFLNQPQNQSISLRSWAYPNF